MTGLAATLALVTALTFGGGLLTFAVAFLALSLLGAYSGANWTLIPVQTDHPFRSKLDTDSGPI
jgi:hypothetical protein